MAKIIAIETIRSRVKSEASASVTIGGRRRISPDAYVIVLADTDDQSSPLNEPIMGAGQRKHL